MSLYKPTKDEIEKHSLEISDILNNKKKEPEKIIETKKEIEYFNYNNLLIEKSDELDSADYNSSLNRIKKLGFTDHLPASTIMNLLIDDVEGFLPAELNKLVFRLKTNSFWTSSKLLAYDYDILLSESLGSSKILTQNYFNKSKFSLTAILLKNSFGKDNSLKKISTFCPDLIKNLFSRKYEFLPPEIKEKGFIYLPNLGLETRLVTRIDKNYGLINPISNFNYSIGYKRI